MDYKTLLFEAKEVSSEGQIKGYGAVFNNVDGGNDVIVADAFSGSIERMTSGGMKPKMLWQHDPAQPIGVWDTMKADERGLFMEGRIIADVAKGKETIALLKAGAVDGLSIGYKTLQASYKDTKEGRVREIKKADVWETSIVTFPMNEEARVTDVKQLQSPREVEQLLRKQGVPGSFAKLVALYGYDGAMERLNTDPGGDEEARVAQLTALAQKLQKLKEAFHAEG